MSCQLKRKTADISHDTCSSEEDKGGNKKVGKKNAKKIKKSRIEQTFKIHYSGFLTSADRNERRNSSVKLKLDIETNEDEIRNSLISELPQLRGKNFSFFTKDNDGRYYSCPCKLKCEGKDHIPAEWNARNISRAARSNRTVYISIEIDNMAPSTSGCNGDPINSHLNEQERDSASYLHQSVSCPNLPSAGSTGLGDRIMTQFVGQNNSDLRRQQLELTQFPQACPVESDRPGDQNRGNAGVQESSSASCEITLPRQENTKFKSLINIEQIPQPEQIQINPLHWVPHGETTDSFREKCQEGVPKSLNASSSGFESISGESNRRPSANVQDEFTFDDILLLRYLLSEEPPLEIKEIVPNNGDVKIDNMAPSTSGCNGDPINSHLNEQERDSASYLHQSASCPNLPSAGSTGLEDRTMTRFVGQNNSDLRRQQLELTQFPQACPVESDRPGDRNRGNAGVQESSSASSRGWETTLPRQENRKFKSLENLDKIAQPEQIQITHLQRVPHGERTDSFGEQCQEGVPKSLNASSSGFESISGESSHRPSANVQDESTSDFDLLLEYVESKEPPLEIKEIVPNNGDVKGGFTFYLELTTHCIADFEVQFGQNDPINVQRIDETHYKGTVPENASSLVGEEEVRIVNTFQDTKNAVTFRYTDESLKERHEVKENIKHEDELRKLLLATAKKFGEMNLKSKEATCRYHEHGGSKTQPLPLLHIVADTAARINSIQFFEILLSTHAGHTAFREYQPTLKGIAKAKGHEELASLLEKKYLMFEDDENDIDGKEDCKEITKDQSIEKWSLQSTDSFKSLHGYLADWESPTPLSSLQVSVDEIFPEDTFAEQQAYLVFNGRDQSAICHEKCEMSDENKEDGESYTSFSPLQVSSGEVWLEGMFDVQKATPGRQDSNTSDKWPSEGGANAGERRSSDVQDYTVKEPQETLESKSPEKSDSYHEKGPSYGKIEMREDHKLYETNSPVEEMKLVGRPSQDPACLPADYVPRGSYETLSCKEGKSMAKVRGPSHEQVGIHLCSSGNLGIQDASCTIQPSDGSEGYLHTRKLDKKPSKISRKSHYKMWPQELVEIDCSSPSEYSLMELEESLSCVSANELATGRDVIDHSNHPNNFDVHGNQNKGESRCSFMRNNRVKIISFVIGVFLIAIVIPIFALVIGKEKRAFPTPEPMSSPCNLAQHWIEDEEGSHLCIDCRTCPPGEGLSKECGGSELLPFNTTVTCVPCIAGVSFSRYEDSSSCTPCSSCSQGQAVNQSCSTEWDVKCSKKCFSKHRYYDEEKGGCLNCSRCCGDHADLVVAECREKLGAGSSMICSFNSSVNRCYKTSQPTHTTIQNSLTQPTPTAILFSLSPPRVDGPSSDWILVGAIMGGLIMSAFVLFSCYKIRLAKFPKSSNRTSEEGTICELSLMNLEEDLSLIEEDISHKRKTLADSRPLRDLLNSSELEEICELLDAPVCGKLPYEAISRWYGASHTRLKTRFRYGKSEAVIAWLVAERPELTVGEFATVVKEKARRTDAADKLKAFDAKATIELTCEMHV